MHKTVVAARLIVAQTAWVTTPIAVFLAMMLQVVCTTFSSIAHNTAGVVDAIEKIDCCDSTRVFTFDVENLYGCINQARAVAVIRAALIKHYTRYPVPMWGALIEFILSLLVIVFEAQFCVYSMQGQTSYWLQHLGVSTGLPCGTQIANLLLQAPDLTIASSFRADIDLYKRYIDDILIVARNIQAGRLVCLTSLTFKFASRMTHKMPKTQGIVPFGI